MKYYRVKTGYGADDFISVDESELPTAIRAQVTGRVGVFQEGTVSGNHIMSITADLQRAMGYNRDYQLRGEDYREIGSKREEHNRFLDETKLAVERQFDNPTQKFLN